MRLRGLLARAAGPLGGPLGRRLLGGLLILSLLPLLLSNGLGYFRSTTIIEGLVERYLDGIAHLQALHVGDQVERHLLYLRAMAGDETLQRELEVSASGRQRGATVERGENAYLSRQLEVYSGFEALYVFTGDGTIVASAPLPPDALGLWIGPPLAARDNPVEVTRDAVPPRTPHLRLAVRIPRVAGRTGPLYVGGYIAVLGPSAFLQIPEHTARSVETFVVDADGVPIFVSHPHGLIDYGAMLASPLLGGVARGSAVYADRQGVEVVGTMVPVPNLGWRLITEVPVADALEDLRQLRRVSLWLGTMLAGVVMALALVLARRVVAPIRRLVNATRRLAAGDLSSRVEIRERTEVGELATAFNDMASDIARAQERARELHDREIERAGQLATVGELAAGIAHEIKNPMMGIAGGLDLIVRATHDQADLHPIIGETRRQVQRVEHAIRDLLAFARPTAPTLSVTEVNAIVERSLALVRPLADGARVSVRFEAGQTPPTMADSDLLGQALVNLLVNGAQAAGPGGGLSVVTRTTNGQVEILVSDTGPGIPRERRDQIFKPFFTTKHHGTGLGLSITRGIVERHGGTIRVESVVGRGTTFVVTLPVRRTADAGGPAGAAGLRGA